MFRFRLWTAGLLLLALMAWLAHPLKGEELPDVVAGLVRQLNSSSPEKRDAAESRLLQLGPSVLEHLPQLPPGTPVEVRVRVARVRKALEKAASERSAAASRVELSFKDQPLSKVLTELERQSGNALVDLRRTFGPAEAEPRISLEVKDTPWFEAVDRVFAEANLSWQPFGVPTGRIGYVESEGTAGPKPAYAGPFRISADTVESVLNLAAPRSGATRVTLRVLWEPRLRPVAVELPLDSLQLVDDQGQSLAPLVPSGQVEAAVGAAAGTQIVLPLELHPADAKRIATLEGELAAILPGRTADFEFSNLDEVKSKEVRQGAARVLLERVRKNGELYQAFVRVRFDDAEDALESHRGWIYGNEAFLLDAKGQRIEPAASEATRQAPNEMGFAFLFAIDKPLAEHKFVYRTPTSLQRQGLKFKLSDLPLP